MIRFLAFCILLLIAHLLPLVVFVVAAFVYVFRFTGYELLFVGFIIDAQFGFAHSNLGFRYTLIAALLSAAAYLIKPYTRFSDSEI